MKLYIEEQVRKAIELSYTFGLAKPNCGRLSDIPNVQNKIINIKSMTPIELPSDEEIEHESGVISSLPSYQDTFRRGAKYVIDKIQGGNK